MSNYYDVDPSGKAQLEPRGVFYLNVSVREIELRVLGAPLHSADFISKRDGSIGNILKGYSNKKPLANEFVSQGLFIDYS